LTIELPARTSKPFSQLRYRFGNQRIGLLHSAAWLVYESGLNLVPSRPKLGTVLF
jgi:hypothetical protein